MERMERTEGCVRGLSSVPGAGWGGGLPRGGVIRGGGRGIGSPVRRSRQGYRNAAGGRSRPSPGGDYRFSGSPVWRVRAVVAGPFGNAAAGGVRPSPCGWVSAHRALRYGDQRGTPVAAQGTMRCEAPRHRHRAGDRHWASVAGDPHLVAAGSPAPTHRDRDVRRGSLKVSPGVKAASESSAWTFGLRVQPPLSRRGVVDRHRAHARVHVGVDLVDQHSRAAHRLVVASRGCCSSTA